MYTGLPWRPPIVPQYVHRSCPQMKASACARGPNMWCTKPCRLCCRADDQTPTTKFERAQETNSRMKGRL